MPSPGCDQPDWAFFVKGAVYKVRQMFPGIPVDILESMAWEAIGVANAHFKSDKGIPLTAWLILKTPWELVDIIRREWTSRSGKARHPVTNETDFMAWTGWVDPDGTNSFVNSEAICTD